MGAALAQTNPEQDRAEFIAFFQQRFTGIALDDYIHGAMIANPDGKAQYDKIMEFPPFLGDIERGKKLWETPFRDGKTFAGCYPNGGRNVLGNYPYFDEAQGKVVTFEMSLNDCLKRNGEAAFDYGGRNTMGVLTSYARSLSDGMRLDVKVGSSKAREKYAAGKALFFERTGQLNASCAGCHYYNAGHIMRMEIISPALGHATHWPIYRGGEELMTFQGRFKRCLEAMRTVPHGYASEEWNNLEYFLSYLSNGLPLQSNVFRK
jgi:L-cysteine S-thiosulfotransferase